MLPREPADSITRIGLPRWYERQRIDSHLALGTCILAGFLSAACLEALGTEIAPLPLAGGLAIAVASGTLA